MGKPKQPTKPIKRYRWRKWRILDSSDGFFTCARPGRRLGPSLSVPDEEVRGWALWIAQFVPVTVVSLLGEKQDGMSEFWFYSFHGGRDDPAARGNRPTFAEVLHDIHAGIELVECPTTDFKPVTEKQRSEAAAAIREGVASGRTVVLVDSGGEQRTNQVATLIAVEHTAAD